MLQRGKRRAISCGSVWYHRFYYNNVDAKQIVIDPYRTTQAQHAEERGGLHLKIVPGTDAILATAIIQEILRQEAWDKEYVEYVRRFDVVRKVAAMPQFSLENAAKTTGIPADKIKAAADMLVAHKGKTMILREKGILHQMAAFEHQFAFTALGVILGNLGKPGATTSRAGGHPGGVWYWPPEPASREHNKDLLKALREGKIKLLWTLARNVFKQITNLNVHRPLIEKTFFIVQDRIRTDMNDAADVVFPAATWGEINGVASSEDRRRRLQQKFMGPPGQARPDWQILADVAKRLGIEGFDWKSDEEVWDEIRGKCPDIGDIDWNMLREAGTDGVKWPRAGGTGIERLFSDQAEELRGKRFYTDDDKIHLEQMELIGKLDLNKFEWGEVNEEFPVMAFDFRIKGLWNSGYTYWVSSGGACHNRHDPRQCRSDRSLSEGRPGIQLRDPVRDQPDQRRSGHHGRGGCGPRLVPKGRPGKGERPICPSPTGTPRSQPRVKRRERSERRATLGERGKRNPSTAKPRRGGTNRRVLAMPQSLAKVIVHITYSTKHRQPWLRDPNLRAELYAYDATVLRNDVDSPAILINGVEDHIHILCLLSRKVTVHGAEGAVGVVPSGRHVSCETTGPRPHVSGTSDGGRRPAKKDSTVS